MGVMMARFKYDVVVVDPPAPGVASAAASPAAVALVQQPGARFYVTTMAAVAVTVVVGIGVIISFSRKPAVSIATWTPVVALAPTGTPTDAPTLTSTPTLVTLTPTMTPTGTPTDAPTLTSTPTLVTLTPTMTPTWSPTPTITPIGPSTFATSTPSARPTPSARLVGDAAICGDAMAVVGQVHNGSVVRLFWEDGSELGRGAPGVDGQFAISFVVPCVVRGYHIVRVSWSEGKRDQFIDLILSVSVPTPIPTHTPTPTGTPTPVTPTPTPTPTMTPHPTPVGGWPYLLYLPAVFREN